MNKGLNQYYTDQVYSDHLVKELSSPFPLSVADLGFGEGSLLHAARKRWNHLKLIGVDIDLLNVQNANKSKFIDAIHYDGFNPDLPDTITEKYGNIDLLVSNPPFFFKSIDESIRTILKKSDLWDCISAKSKKVPAELVFLAQNIRLLNNQNELGIILPAGLVSGEKWVSLREHLFGEFNISKVIQLPTNSFKRTDAQTFIFIMNKTIPVRTEIELSHVLYDKTISISRADAIHRADYSFYNKTEINSDKLYISPQQFSIYRGNTTHKQLLASAKYFIHTNQLPKEPASLKLPNYTFGQSNLATTGDILLARVGRRCIGRVAVVERGTLPISDCVIVIRPKDDNARKKIWEKLKSESSKQILESMSLGVGAKYLTHSLIKDFLSNV
jgi:type I restriction enzyme M protein